ncbi:S-layer homology domain-containing protein [Acutalibacter sp. 1XD8-33]|nr:S-layer homology domain-containing protein [Acutalibacter sp. 1XD8-33]
MHEKALALAKEKNPQATRAACYSVKFLEQAAGGGEIRSIPIAEDGTVILKLQLSGKAAPDTFQVYRYGPDGSGFTQVEVLPIISEGDKSYLLFETDAFGYFSVISAPGASGAFSDVPKGEWYYEAVEYVRKNQLMSGVGGGRFQPQDTLTRAQFAQIVYQAQGMPKASKAGFTDVKPGAWYYDAVCYTAETGITGGYGDGRFGPGDPITWEQMAVMLWRWEKINNKNLKDPNLALDFPDAAQVSEYAQTAMRWAVEQGILHGKNGRLDPKGYAKRSETAQIMMNYFEGR